ncbi:unnamed protein product [Cuscuta epithymum]|uniref:Uncharacterized protein n=1 Tax=Cuscuta epithymum TaxID=186058 RepID=A0AAV0FVU9_9ASTE|nr:unnamed protein product [Cuscuta epithymum]
MESCAKLLTIFSFDMERRELEVRLWRCLLLVVCVLEFTMVMDIFGWTLDVLLFVGANIEIWKCIVTHGFCVSDLAEEKYTLMGRDFKCALELFFGGLAMAVSYILPYNIEHAAVLACWSLQLYGWSRLSGYYDLGAWEVFVTVPMQAFMYCFFAGMMNKEMSNNNRLLLSAMALGFWGSLSIYRFRTYTPPPPQIPEEYDVLPDG